MRLVGVFGQLILVNVISQTIIWTFIQPIFLSPLRHIPGPKHGNILFGHSRQVRLSMPRGEKAREWMETIPNEGLIRFRDLFNREGLIVTTPMTLKTVLNDNAYDYIKQPSTVDALRPVLGDGLVLVEGDVHKFQRKRQYHDLLMDMYTDISRPSTLFLRSSHPRIIPDLLGQSLRAYTSAWGVCERSRD